jgi:hypothetical protein
MVADVPTVTVYGGDTVDWPTYTLKDSAGNFRDLDDEGWTDWKAQWRAKPEAGDPIELTVDATAASAGMLRLSATSAQTEAMQGPGFWDLQATQGDRVQTFLRGRTKWVQDVTR